MQITVNHWGNSLALRLPKNLIDGFAIQAGTKMEAHATAEGLFLKPLPETNSMLSAGQSVDLDAMVSKITKKNRPSVTEEAPRGREIW